jgi:hypothetical protein
MTHIIGKENIEYDRTRLVKSVQKTAVANLTPIGQAEDFAHRVVEKVEKWLNEKTEITAAELRLQTANAMVEYDSETAYLYENENKLF